MTLVLEDLVSKAGARVSFNHMRFPILNSGIHHTREAQKLLRQSAEQGFGSPILVNNLGCDPPVQLSESSLKA